VCRLGAEMDNFDFTLYVGGWVGSRDDLEGRGSRQVRWSSGGTFLVRQNNTQLNRVTHITKHGKQWVDEMSGTRNKLRRADSWLPILV